MSYYCAFLLDQWSLRLALRSIKMNSLNPIPSRRFFCRRKRSIQGRRCSSAFPPNLVEHEKRRRDVNETLFVRALCPCRKGDFPLGQIRLLCNASASSVVDQAPWVITYGFPSGRFCCVEVHNALWAISLHASCDVSGCWWYSWGRWGPASVADVFPAIFPLESNVSRHPFVWSGSKRWSDIRGNMMMITSIPTMFFFQCLWTSSCFVWDVITFRNSRISMNSFEINFLAIYLRAMYVKTGAKYREARRRGRRKLPISVAESDRNRKTPKNKSEFELRHAFYSSICSHHLRHDFSDGPAYRTGQH